jgi:hypothetical protein
VLGRQAVSLGLPQGPPALIPPQIFVCLCVSSGLLMFGLHRHGEGASCELRFLSVYVWVPVAVSFLLGFIVFVWFLVHGEIARSAEGCNGRPGCMDG